jgi:TRAP-type mannitol/chloroaromatic compound transport system permease small subunit
MKKLLFFISFMACTFIFAQKIITKKYISGENAENAKVLFIKYHDGIIAQKFKIEYQDDLSSNSIDVDYTTSDKKGK